jgi:hypothetical protein
VGGSEVARSDLGEVGALDAANAELVPALEVEPGPGPDVEHTGITAQRDVRTHEASEDPAPHGVHPPVEGVPETDPTNRVQGVVGREAPLPVLRCVERHRLECLSNSRGGAKNIETPRAGAG